MKESVHISDCVETQIAKSTINSYPYECCGFLIADNNNMVFRIFKCSNMAQNPENSFLITPFDYLKMLKTLKINEKIAGIYHSHPKGSLSPSEPDKLFMFDNCLFLISAFYNIDTTNIKSIGSEDETNIKIRCYKWNSFYNKFNELDLI